MDLSLVLPMKLNPIKDFVSVRNLKFLEFSLKHRSIIKFLIDELLELFYKQKYKTLINSQKCLDTFLNCLQDLKLSVKLLKEIMKRLTKN